MSDVYGIFEVSYKNKILTEKGLRRIDKIMICFYKVDDFSRYKLYTFDKKLQEV